MQVLALRLGLQGILQLEQEVSRVVKAVSIRVASLEFRTALPFQFVIAMDLSQFRVYTTPRAGGFPRVRRLATCLTSW